jgi:hypothetical protein
MHGGAPPLGRRLNVRGIVGPLGLEVSREPIDYARNIIASMYLVAPLVALREKVLRFEGEIQSP